MAVDVVRGVRGSEGISAMKLSVMFEPRDLWIGLYWDRRKVGKRIEHDSCLGRVWVDTFRLYLYFCIIPTLVLKVVL